MPSLPLAPAVHLGFYMKEDDLGHKGTPTRVIFFSECGHPAAVIKALWMSGYMKHWCMAPICDPHWSFLLLSQQLWSTAYSVTARQSQSPGSHFILMLHYKMHFFSIKCQHHPQGSLVMPFPQGEVCWGHSSQSEWGGDGPATQSCLGECRGVIRQSWHASWDSVLDMELVQFRTEQLKKNHKEALTLGWSGKVNQ